ncbi:helix-turn-helix transcriptional regulator [Streptomyces sp. B1866]|uniref:helix-turn-helix domain-containing protein n=1 Tax=Streptomyces sp. B1866 TaxID=3075431 RepID=UPI00288D26D9|nr:helix-turn-helix transcriptional regulator [Streptomyces sp. B1866]MDT3396447.1 helix-turn-helix transcriptional regulator [Streptomyces sp. B1866]
MSTDFQTARIALGARLRELRTEAGLNGKRLAERLGWQPSKVSRLENARQTAAPEDLEAWAHAVGAPAEAEDLKGRLRGLESQHRSWRRQLAGGFRARQELAIAETSKTRTIRAVEIGCIPGLLQTPDYARHMFATYAAFQQTPRDIEEAVRARIRRQEALYEPGRRFHFLVWEGALRVLVCPPQVMVAQLDRLLSVIGMDTVEFGVIPFAARLRLAPDHGFWIYDDRFVTVETINTEMWLDSPDDIALYVRAWEWMAESAVYGHQAHRLITRARAALDAPSA